MTDQPGKDPDPRAVQETHKATLESLYANTNYPGRIFIRTSNPNSGVIDVVVPRPQSYEAALTIAFHQLGDRIYVDPGTSLQDAYFEYRIPVSDFSNGYRWAKLPRECWTRIVHDGDHLQLCFKKVSNEKPTRTTVKFVELHEIPNSQGRVISFPRPGSYAVAKLVANILFYESKSVSPIMLFLKEKEKPFERWRVVKSDITEKDWMAATEDVEIGVYIKYQA